MMPRGARLPVVAGLEAVAKVTTVRGLRDGGTETLEVGDERRRDEAVSGERKVVEKMLEESAISSGKRKRK